MKILVTGDRGFLGRHLTPTLINNGHEVIRCNTDSFNLLDYEWLKAASRHTFDVIFHLATYAKAGDWCIKNAGDQWLINQQINTNMLRFWVEEQPQAKLITMGTSCVYSNCEDSENTREHFYTLSGVASDGALFSYASTKRMMQIGLQALGRQYGLKWLTFIPSTLYGPGFDVEDSHFIFDLIKKFHAAKVGNDDVRLWGDGRQRRELVHISDAVEAMYKLMHLEDQIINLGAGTDYELREFAQMVATHTEYTGPVLWDGSRYTGARRKILNSDKITGLLGPNWQKVPLSSGIKQSVNYYLTLNSPSTNR